MKQKQGKLFYFIMQLKGVLHKNTAKALWWIMKNRSMKYSLKIHVFLSFSIIGNIAAYKILSSSTH